jgi:hypothetical protein
MIDENASGQSADRCGNGEWHEREIVHGIGQGDALSAEAKGFLDSPSDGDGGMASAVRNRFSGKACMNNMAALAAGKEM